LDCAARDDWQSRAEGAEPGGDAYELIHGYARRLKVEPVISALPPTPQPAAALPAL